MQNSVSGEPVAFLVVSCDRYADLWPPFFHSLHKYWPDCPYPTYLLTNFAEVDAPGVRTIRIGEDRAYADNLRIALEQIDAPWVLLWLEDVFISQRVDTALLEKLVRTAQSIPVGYLNLSPDLPLSYHPTDVDGMIGPLPKGVRYRSAVGLSLYHVETLKKLLTPGASAWDLDVGTMSDAFDEPFYALTPKGAARRPIVWAHAVVKGSWYWPAIPFMKREGFAHTLKGRRRLGLKAIVYIFGFKLHNFLFRLTKTYWR